MQVIWDTIKRPNLCIIGIEKEDKLKTEITHAIKHMPYLEKEGHPDPGGFQKTKQARSEKYHPLHILYLKTLNI
jgi:hypothetical protein